MKLIQDFWMLLVALLFAGASICHAAAQIAAPPKAGVTAVTIRERGEDTVVANGGNRTFILSHTPEDPAEIFVYVNGLLQSQNDDYLVLNKTYIIFSMPAPATTDRVRFWYRGIR
jgi:hypothetical protein